MTNSKHQASNNLETTMTKNSTPLRLHEIAVTSYLFDKVFNFNTSLKEFFREVGGCVDLGQHAHRKYLLKWLNNWGCRQFASGSMKVPAAGSAHGTSGTARRCLATMFDLLDASDTQLEVVADAYRDLSRCIACVKGNGITATIGPVGAAKILFAIRPKLAPPWDTPIRKKFGYFTSRDSYLAFLQDTQAGLKNLDMQCRKHGFPLPELPARLGRKNPQDTAAKLADEFYWLTITRGASLPTINDLGQWVEWSSEEHNASR